MKEAAHPLSRPLPHDGDPGRQACPHHGDEGRHLAGEERLILVGRSFVVGAHRGVEGGMPSVGQVLDAPRSCLALRHHDVAGLEGTNDAAAVEEGIRRLVRIGVAGLDVPLEVLDLGPQRLIQLVTGRWGNEVGRLGPVQEDVPATEPVRAIDRPRLVEPVAPRVPMHLRPSSLALGDEPDVELDTGLGLDRLSELFDGPDLRLVEGCSDDDERVEVAQRRVLAGRDRPAVGPHRDDVVAGGRHEGVAQPSADQLLQGQGRLMVCRRVRREDETKVGALRRGLVLDGGRR